MTMLCRCGHSDERGKHPGGGPCGAYECPCEGFADVWDAKPLTPGMSAGAPLEPSRSGVLTYGGETWIGLRSHTARLAQ